MTKTFTEHRETVLLKLHTDMKVMIQSQIQRLQTKKWLIQDDDIVREYSSLQGDEMDTPPEGASELICTTLRSQASVIFDHSDLPTLLCILGYAVFLVYALGWFFGSGSSDIYDQELNPFGKCMADIYGPTL